MNIQEASGDLQEGGIMFQSSEASYLKTKTKNDGKLEKLGSGKSGIHLAHLPCA